MPPGLNAAIAYDSTEFIRASIYEVAKTLVEAAVIVIVVIFLFLGNLRSTFIPIVTIPLSLVGVMIALLALGYSINLLTLLALVLGIGLVVDDAIVVVENIYRHIEEGMTPFDAAIRGAHEIALPVDRDDDHAGRGLRADRLRLGRHRRAVPRIRLHARRRRRRVRLHRADAVADDVLETAEATTSGTAGSAASSTAFERLRRAYQRRLHRTLNFRALTLLILVGVLALTGVMYVSTPRELAPEEDQGILLDAGQDAADRQPRLHRAGDAARSTSEAQAVPEMAHAVRHQRLSERALGLRRHPAEALGRAHAQPEAGAGGAGAEVPRRADGAGAGLLAAGAARLDRRPADAVRHPHDRRLSRRSPTSR